MAAIATPEILDQKILARLQMQASEGADLETMMRCVQEDLGFSPEFVVPVFAYFCKAFSLPLLEFLPLREWIETNDNSLISGLLAKIKEHSTDRY